MRPASTIFCILTALGGSASAGEPTYPVAAECGPAPESEEARRALAAYWFEQGRAQVDREAFADAERSFGCSQAIIPHPSTLYNLARAADWAGDLDTALDALREYLEAAPDAENRAEAEELVVRISGDIALRNNASSFSSSVPATGSPGHETDAQDVMGWISVTLAGAGAAAGVTLGAFAGYEQGKIDDAPDGVSYGVVAEHESKRDDYLLGMGIGFGVAGAAALAGILLLVLDDEPPVAVAPAPWPDGAGLTLVGRF